MFSINPALWSQLLSKEHHRTVFTKNWDLNHYTLEGYIEKQVSFIEYSMSQLYNM